MDGNRLKKLLKEKGMSQQKLAEEIGVHRSAVSLWCVNHNGASEENIKKCAEALGVTIEYLNGEEVDNLEEKTDILRNGSGYVDETAFKAIKHIEYKNMDYCRGEIWEYNLHNNEMKYALVVSVDECMNGKYRSVILLTDEQKGVINVPIVCHGRMYADCGMVSFGMCGRFGNYIKNATDAEMKEIEQGIAKALGIIVPEEGKNLLAERWEKRCEEVQKKMFEAQDEVKMLKAILEKQGRELVAKKELVEKQADELSERETLIETLRKGKILRVEETMEEELIKAKTERDIFKTQYEKLLERLIG